MARNDVEDRPAAGTVVGQNPAPARNRAGIRDHTPGVQGAERPPDPGRHEPDRGGRPAPAAQQSGFEVDSVVEEIVDDQGLDGACSRRTAEGGTRRRAGHDGGDRRRPLRAATPTAADDHTTTDAVTRRIRVAVVAGGRSSEHEISLASARSVLEALDPERYETTTIAIGRDGRWAIGHGRQEQAC